MVHGVIRHVQNFFNCNTKPSVVQVKINILNMIVLSMLIFTAYLPMLGKKKAGVLTRSTWACISA